MKDLGLCIILLGCFFSLLLGLAYNSTKTLGGGITLRDFVWALLFACGSWISFAYLVYVMKRG